MAHEDEGFSVDLRDFKPGSRRGRRDSEPVLLDGWTWSASPLDHWLMATAECQRLAAEDRTGCQRAAWEQHKLACWNCDRQDTFARILAFAAERYAGRGVAA